ncbi:MAG TPA: S8 family peptidase [Longimicrobiales bacterium]|nr:S8 family peptidase [Longimicrobiales bacterium]
MKRNFLVLLFLGLAACSSAATPTAAPPPPPPPPPREAEVTPPPTPEPTPAAPAFRTAARDWHLLDVAEGYPGIGVARAYSELLADRQPQRTVVVAVIDGGVDTAHVDLNANLWRNEDEVAGNGRDDDGNGYMDDTRGWNFIGGADGESVQWDTFEVTRLHAQCLSGALSDGARCEQIAADYEERRNEASSTLQQIQLIGNALTQILPLLQAAVAPDTLSAERVNALPASSPQLGQAKQLYLQLAANGITPAVLEEAREQYESQLEYGLNTDFEPRPIVGDDYSDKDERIYGNPDPAGPDPKHGTHVAGIIGAVRGNDEGIDGVASSVVIMSVRTVPDGDERDKDVANAIRYAVDNGAHVINMSFGKDYSPFKPVVDAAIRYADEHGVLMVHAAGNDGKNTDEEPNFPSPVYDDGGRAQLWIEVGASSWRGADTLAASFSNYGQQRVDVFAPGEAITSTVPGGGYEPQDGTSMAAPVVSGLAALIMAYYPSLSAADVRQVILDSATRHTEVSALRPGDGTHVQFGTLSATGAIVNAYEALKLAAERAARMN